MPGVGVAGLHELVGNALVLEGEKERTTNLRGEPLKGERPEMKLYNARYILPALGVFLVAVTFPVWRGLAAHDAGFKSPPNPNGERCIEPKGFMRAQHMRLLGRWRDEVVREDRRVYIAKDGRAWEKSLKTCVACHGHTDAQGKSTTAAAACNECHSYVNARLTAGIAIMRSGTGR